MAIPAKTDSTHQPTSSELGAALIEGWIHVPSQPLKTLRPPTMRPNGSSDESRSGAAGGVAQWSFGAAVRGVEERAQESAATVRLWLGVNIDGSM